jgi:hypothetical protein
MEDKMWISWSNFDSMIAAKKFVFFGASELAEKILGKCLKKPEFFLDNNEGKQGTDFHGIRIIKPEDIKKYIKDCIIIITMTSDHNSIISQLEGMGYEKGVDFFFSPSQLNQRIERDIKENQQTVIFTSATNPNPNSDVSGGGIYKFTFKNRELTKLSSGRYCQFFKAKDMYYVVEHYQGVKVFDLDFNHVKTYEILPWSLPHGVTMNMELEQLYISNTGLDSISVVDMKTGERIDEIFIKNDKESKEFDMHHINDLAYYNGYLYASMFSFSGEWKQGCYDGGVAKIDVNKKEVVGYVMKDMWMPHTIQFIGGEIALADSMRGDVYKTSTKKLVNLPGFIRGFDYDGRYYYIGQSEHRHFDRLKDYASVIHLNCGIHVFDEETKVNRFYDLGELSNIHQIRVME